MPQLPTVQLPTSPPSQRQKLRDDTVIAPAPAPSCVAARFIPTVSPLVEVFCAPYCAPARAALATVMPVKYTRAKSEAIMATSASTGRTIANSTAADPVAERRPEFSVRINAPRLIIFPRFPHIHY